MKFVFKLIVLVAILLTAASCGKNTEVKSPDGLVKIDVTQEEGRILYSVTKHDGTIIDRSSLGFILKEGNLSEGLKIKSIRHSSFNETWEQPWGEEVEVSNNYNQMEVRLVHNSGIEFNVVFRAFDDGIAFRYEFPEQSKLQEFTIMEELTEFSFPEDHQTWSIPWRTEFYEEIYSKNLISELDTVCSPLTIETTDGGFLAIHEANLRDYAAMNLARTNGTTLRVYLTPWSSGEKVFTQVPMQTPWRFVIIGNTPGELMLSRIMLNLNDPCKIEDTSWITPGRYLGIWWGMHVRQYTWGQGPKHGATTENTKRYMDFAAEHGFMGVLVEGWNTGWDEWTNYNFTQPYPDFDIDEVTSYGKKIGVELIGHHETGGEISNYEEQLEDAFRFYKERGVNIVKTGYVGLLDGKEKHNSQYGVRHYMKVLEAAARHRIMLDVHEPIMPTGLQRTWPNLMTQEGVRGQEWDAWSVKRGNTAEHTTILPFTRGLAGPMDFTPGTFDLTHTAKPGARVWTTLAKQLALSVVIYSPLQMSSDMIEKYENNPAFEFLSSCPANWQKTVVPDAQIGEYVTIARKDRDSENWYVGSITNSKARNLKLQLDFLDESASYTAKIFRDADDADFMSNPYPVTIEEVDVDSSSVLDINLAAGGGTAIIISKK